MKYLIYSFARFGNVAKRGVEFHHSAPNSAENGERKCLNGNGVSNSVWLCPYIPRYNVKLKKNNNQLSTLHGNPITVYPGGGNDRR